MLNMWSGIAWAFGAKIMKRNDLTCEARQVRLDTMIDLLVCPAYVFPECRRVWRADQLPTVPWKLMTYMKEGPGSRTPTHTERRSACDLRGRTHLPVAARHRRLGASDVVHLGLASTCVNCRLSLRISKRISRRSPDASSGLVRRRWCCSATLIFCRCTKRLALAYPSLVG